MTMEWPGWTSDNIDVFGLVLSGITKNNSEQRNVLLVSHTDKIINGGLVRAYKDKTSTIRIDVNGISLQDKACQFQFWKKNQVPTLPPVYLLESVNFPNYLFYWNQQSVTLQEFSDGENLQSLLNVQWKLPLDHEDPSGNKKLLQANDYSKNIFLVFEQTSSLRTETLSENSFAPFLTTDRSYADQNGAIILDAIKS